MKVGPLSIGVLLVLASGLISAEPSNWPRWRGPNGDGVSTETGWNPKCLDGGAKVLWTANIGTGYSNIAISDGHLYAMGSGDVTHLAFACLDAATGKTIWMQRLMLGVGSQDPMSTPTVDGDRVYGTAQNGMLFCLNTADGRMLWKKGVGPDSSDEVRTFSLGYGRVSSPVVDGALLLINANMAGIALDKMDGRVVWDSGTHIANPLLPFAEAYATPVIADLEGRRAALFLGPASLSAVDTATGKAIWSYDHGEGVEVISDPLISGTVVYFSTSSRGTAVDLRKPRGLMSIIRPQKGPRVLWSGESLRGSIETPVAVEGYLYGTDWDRYVDSWNWHPVLTSDWWFRCVELKTGKVAWEKAMPWVSLSAAGGRLIMLSAKGILTIAEASPKGFSKLCNADVMGGADRPRLFVTPPVLCDGKIYVRNYAGDLICIDARK
jgi:outer membrane protein assembly factor BamB